MTCAQPPPPTPSPRTCSRTAQTGCPGPRRPAQPASHGRASARGCRSLQRGGWVAGLAPAGGRQQVCRHGVSSCKARMHPRPAAHVPDLGPAMCMCLKVGRWYVSWKSVYVPICGGAAKARDGCGCVALNGEQWDVAGDQGCCTQHTQAAQGPRSPCSRPPHLVCGLEAAHVGEGEGGDLHVDAPDVAARLGANCGLGAGAVGVWQGLRPTQGQAAWHAICLGSHRLSALTASRHQQEQPTLHT